MLETGCRPGEVAKVAGTYCSQDLTMWIFDEHKTDRTGMARVVYLTPPVQALTKKLWHSTRPGRSFARLGSLAE
jgi:hypothetical protein